MDILFAGTPKASAKILKYLAIHNDINVIGAITQPDKPQKEEIKFFVLKFQLKQSHLISRPINQMIWIIMILRT